jgi:hypothetical protein
MNDEKPEIYGLHSAAIVELARVLYEKMEHLDPGSGGGFDWDELPARDVEYYALCVESILERESLVRASLTDDHMINRESELTE